MFILKARRCILLESSYDILWRILLLFLVFLHISLSQIIMSILLHWTSLFMFKSDRIVVYENFNDICHFIHKDLKNNFHEKVVFLTNKLTIIFVDKK
jgi:hypothetical protein